MMWTKQQALYSGMLNASGLIDDLYHRLLLYSEDFRLVNSWVPHKDLLDYQHGEPSD